MATIQIDGEFAHLQDVLGTIPMVRNLITLCLCFPLDASTETNEIEKALMSALSKLADAFPFLAGRVVIDGIKDGHSGIPKIVRHENKVPLIINDLTKEASVATCAEMRKARYPASMLDPTLLLPSICFDSYPVDPALVAPVFMMQANFIRGGLLLSCVGNHTIMDATGMGIVIELFAKALRDESFTDDDKKLGNQPRGSVIPLLGEDYQPGPELDDIIPFAVDAALQNTLESKSQKCAWFKFTSSSLARLKADASNQDIVPYISTDDAITALCWQVVSRARQARLGENAKTQVARPVSMRKYFGLKKYVGHMADTIYTEAEDVCKLPLGTAAGILRRELLQDDKIKYHAQALATMCSRLTDRSKLVYGANSDLNCDMLLSSWTVMGTCGYSYGDLLGIPEATRCPWTDYKIPMIIALPKDEDDGMCLVMSFAEDEMDKILNDEQLLAYGEFMN